MAHIMQVLIFSTFFLLVYGQNSMDPYGFEDRPTISGLFNLRKLLQSVAQLTYPITSSINNAVGTLMDSNNYQPPRNYYYNVKNQYANIQHLYKPDFYDYNNDYDAQFLKPYDTAEAGDGFLFHDSEIQLEPESNNADTDRRISLSDIFESAPNYKPKPESIPADDNGDLVSTRPLEILLPEDKNEGTFNNVIFLSGKETPNQYAPGIIHLGNEGSNGEPITNPNGKQPDNLPSGGESTFPNLQNQPPTVNAPLTNNDNAPANVLPASKGAQPNIIYVILNPNGSNPGINSPINLQSNSEVKLNEGDASNSANRYWYNIVPSNAESDPPLMSVNDDFDVDIPIILIPADDQE